MIKNYTYFILVCLFVGFTNAKAQSTYCPPNIDFEGGNYGYWKFYRGTCCPINTPTLGQVNGRHTLTNGAGVDPFGGFPIVAPNGGNYSLKLGNSSTGGQAEKASYFVHIPAGLNNYSLIYNFAVVFEDPGHTPAQQPRFVVSAVDSATNTPIPCAEYTYVSGSGLPGFTYNSFDQVWWRGWSTASLDLSGLGGQTVIVSFASGDCSLSGHFGYGYIDLACSLFQISSVVCSGQPTQTFIAPPGFMSYNWYDSSYVNLVGSGQSITIPTPAQNSVYHVILSPFPGFGCPDTLTSIVTISNTSTNTINQTICAPDSYLGYSSSGTYIDTFVNALSCDSFRVLNLNVIPISDTNINETICSPNTYAGYSSTGTYIDTLACVGSGCDSIRTIQLIVLPAPNSSFTQTICEPDSFFGYTSSGVYIDSFISVNGCDSIRTLNLTVLAQSFITFNQVICEPNSFLGYTATGIYVDTFLNTQGCDSIRTVNLTVNNISYSTINQSICDLSSYLGYTSSGTYIDTLVNANGCDSIRALNLTVLPNVQTNLNQTICAPNTYLGYSSTGIYTDTFSTVSGCDSVRILDLVVNPVSSILLVETICEPDSYNGYSTSGVYIDTFVNIYGCDSIRTINLTVNPITYQTISQTICQPNSYLGYSTTGTYIDTLINANGCDSIRTLNLTVNNITDTIINASICNGSSFLGYTTAGTYIDTFINSNGCDSIRTINLSVVPIIQTNLSQTICYPDSYLGYSISGTYIDTFISAFGCDSLRVLNLIVNQPTTSLINETICEPYSFLGYSVTGIYIDTLVNANGCDSIRTLSLLVNERTDSIINQTICAPNSFLGYSSSGFYIDTFVNANGCDSMRFLNLTVNNITYYTLNKTICDSSAYLGYTASGTYIDTFLNSNGCDSIRILNLVLNTPIEMDTSITLCKGLSYFAGGALQTTNGIYIDSLMTPIGCDSIVTTMLSFIDIVFPDLGPDTTFCEGDSVLLFPGHFNYYFWWDGDTNNDRKNVYTAGKYYVMVSNDMTCFASDTIDLLTYPQPNIQILHSIKDLCKSDTINLYGTGGLQYFWYLNDYFNTPKFVGNAINFTVNEQTKITLIGIDENNCKAKDELNLFYIPCCGNISVPNAFSPNGDLNNDYFKAITNGSFEVFNFKIFDRWGNIVFESNDKNGKWDGNYKGSAAESGTYFYLLKAKCYDDAKTNLLKGDVLLLR